MTQDRSALVDLLETLGAADGGSVMRRLLGHGLQALIEAEASGVIGAAPHGRAPARLAQRNGSRRNWAFVGFIPSVAVLSLLYAVVVECGSQGRDAAGWRRSSG